LWTRCVGFLSWDVEETMSQQETMLRDHLRMASESALATALTRGRAVSNSKEFREAVPLTSYENYKDTLGECRNDVLVRTPASWLLTSGRSDGKPKWVPLSAEAKAQLGWSTLGLFLAATAHERGDVRLHRGTRLLNMTAPPPYLSGTAVESLVDLGLWGTEPYPPNDPALAALSFERRMAVGFQRATQHGIDVAVSYSSVLAGVGAAFANRNFRLPATNPLRDQAAFARVTRGRLSALMARRALLPRDVWKPQAIVAGGMDSSLFRPQIVEQWGSDPLELIASTEGLFLGMQTWDRSTITLIPYFNFFEFIPQEELVKEEHQAGHVPATLLLDDLQVGVVYELVVTNLLGGALARYRTGELFRLAASTNSDAKVALPQFVYCGQRSDLIEIANFARLSERMVASAMSAAGIACVAWTARKEVEAGQPVVHVRYEPLPGHNQGAPTDPERLDAAFRLLDTDWRDMEDIAGLRPLRLTSLPEGTFARLSESSGYSIPRINAPDATIDALLDAAASARLSARPE
jgi:hypothetical protein